MTCNAKHPQEPETYCGRDAWPLVCDACYASGWRILSDGSGCRYAGAGVLVDGEAGTPCAAPCARNPARHDGPCGNWRVDHAERCARLELERDASKAALQELLSPDKHRLVEFKDGTFVFASPVFMMVAEMAAQILKDQSAENYVQIECRHSEMGRIILTVQKGVGQSPHELRRAAEADRDEARAALSALESWVAEARAGVGKAAVGLVALAREARGLGLPRMLMDDHPLVAPLRDLPSTLQSLIDDPAGQAAEARVAERVREAVEAERAACAEIASGCANAVEEAESVYAPSQRIHLDRIQEARAIAAAIRARKEGP